MVAAQGLRVLFFNRSDTRGGAARIVFSLHQYFRKHNVDSYCAVEQKHSEDEHVVEIRNENHANSWERFFLRIKKRLQRSKVRGAWSAIKFAEWLGNPLRKMRHLLGIEEFNYRGSRTIINRLRVSPQVIHGHILHGGYFDLRYLSTLSQTIPTFLTLHDAWLLSGHCAHSFDCVRWKTGCGNCPDLTIPPAVKSDRTSYNWNRKKKIYKASSLYISTPSKWLMDKVEASILMDGCVEKRVIPNGIDLTVYTPGDQAAARRRLGLSEEDFIFLFSANGIRRNRWKDFDLMKAALKIVGEHATGKPIVFLALGEEGVSETIGHAEIRFMPYRADPKSVADFYNAADVYLHAAKADTFPNVVIEALACGTPVIGTNVGGIPEQIKGWDGANTVYNHYKTSEATGILTAAGDVGAFAEAMLTLMNDSELKDTLGANAAIDAQERFSLERQADAFLNWFQEVLAAKKGDKNNGR